MAKQLFDRKLTEFTFQITLIAAIYFLLFAHPIVFNLVDKGFEVVGVHLGDTMLTIVHSIVFAVFFFYTVAFVSKLN